MSTATMNVPDQMPIDPNAEQLIPLVRMKEKIPWLDAYGVCSATIRLWAVKGVRGVKLESCRVGISLASSEAALKRFLIKLSAMDA